MAAFVIPQRASDSIGDGPFRAIGLPAAAEARACRCVPIVPVRLHEIYTHKAGVWIFTRCLRPWPTAAPANTTGIVMMEQGSRTRPGRRDEAIWRRLQSGLSEGAADDSPRRYLRERSDHWPSICSVNSYKATVSSSYTSRKSARGAKLTVPFSITICVMGSFFCMFIRASAARSELAAS